MNHVDRTGRRKRREINQVTVKTFCKNKENQFPIEFDKLNYQDCTAFKC